MKILLCSVPVERPGEELRRKRSEGTFPIMPKVAITSLNSWGEKNGFKSDFYDIDMLYPSDYEIKKFFKKNHYDIIGLSAVVSTSYLQVKRLSKIIKEILPNVVIVCGGYLTAAAKTILEKTKVDICVVGDGEIAWVGLLKHINENIKKNKLPIEYNTEDILNVKGIALINKITKKIEFSGYGLKLATCEMDFPSFDYLKTGLLGNDEALKNYFKPFYNSEGFIMDDRSFEKNRRPMVASILLTKGCVAKCTFCQRGSLGYQVYDLDKLDLHLKNLKENYNVGFLSVDDENFGSNRKQCYEAAEVMHKHNMLWHAGGARVTSVTKEDLIHYKKNGCIAMKFGLESGSQTMLDIMEKKFTVEHIRNAILNCIDIGLYTSFQGFMLGMPGESIETTKKSGKLIAELSSKLGVPPSLLFGNQDLLYAIPLVGTPLYEYGKLHGVIGQSTDDEEEYLKLTSNVAAYKRYFINLNGASMSEVVYWDFQVFLEATRHYRILMKNKSENKKNIEKFIKQIVAKGLNPQVRSKEKKVNIMGAATTQEEKSISINPYFITNFLRQHIVFNQKLSYLPRFLIENFVRILSYLEFLYQKNFLKDSNNLHNKINEIARKKINRIKEEDLSPNLTRQKDRSLRSIVDKIKKIRNINSSKDSIDVLTSGP